MNESHKRNLAIPFFTQRDNTYIWQQKYEKDKFDSVTNKKVEIKDKPFGPKYPMAWRTCNITSLCMLLHYWGLTQETPNQMITKVFGKKEDGWKWLYEETVEKKGETRKGAARLENWSDLKKIAELYIADKEEYKVVQGTLLLTMDKLKELISMGIPVMVSTGLGSYIPGYDQEGHIVVVRGFTADGNVILNDPFGIPVNNNNEIKPESQENRVTGWYYASDSSSIGDNIVIKYSEFLKVFKQTDNAKYLYIEGPLWQMPGGKETDLSNSYPIRADNMWHNGIHLESATGFYSIGPGRLVAARNAEVKKHGSSSFALVKYQMPKQEQKFFYALYMHLKKIDLKLIVRTEGCNR